MTTNKTVNQVFTANKTLTGQIRITTKGDEVFIHGTPAAFKMLAEVILATVGAGGNVFSQNFRAQIAKGDRSGFVLTPDSIEKLSFYCDAKFLGSTSNADDPADEE